jgi:SAM-dependent methyltransferase
MALLKSNEVWGHTASSLSERLIQIGNNSFSADGDYEKYLADKAVEAEYTNDRLKVKPTDIGLEIGSGTGVHAAYFAARCQHLYSVDVSDGFSDLFKSTTSGIENITYNVRRFFPMFPEVKDNSADYCYSSSVFCHLNVYDVYLYFEEVSKKLKAEGRFYINYQTCDDGVADLFKLFLENYRAAGEFTPIPPAEMQFHSNKFFEQVAASFGLYPEIAFSSPAYAEYVFVKTEGKRTIIPKPFEPARAPEPDQPLAETQRPKTLWSRIKAKIAKTQDR